MTVAPFASTTLDLARTQFGTTSVFHFLFVPLTLGLAPLVAVMQTIKKRVFGDSSLTEAAMMMKGKALATCSLLFWVGAVTAGRLLAYTYNYLKFDYRG